MEGSGCLQFTEALTYGDTVEREGTSYRRMDQEWGAWISSASFSALLWVMLRPHLYCLRRYNMVLCGIVRMRSITCNFTTHVRDCWPPAPSRPRRALARVRTMPMAQSRILQHEINRVSMHSSCTRKLTTCTIVA